MQKNIVIIVKEGSTCMERDADSFVPNRLRRSLKTRTSLHENEFALSNFEDQRMQISG